MIILRQLRRQLALCDRQRLRREKLGSDRLKIRRMGCKVNQVPGQEPFRQVNPSNFIHRLTPQDSRLILEPRHRLEKDFANFQLHLSLNWLQEFRLPGVQPLQRREQMG
jgi:hypothetical protein